VTADVTVGDHVEGVLYARGSHNVGHSFFVRDGQLQFDYNALGTHARVTAPISLAPGRHTVTARFDRVGAAGALTIGVDGRDLSSIEIPRIVRMLGSTGTDIGRDALSTVVDDYAGPFPFTGTIHSVTFDIRSRRDASDVRATAAAELSRE
jgi:arylsulfatase